MRPFRRFSYVWLSGPKTRHTKCSDLSSSRIVSPCFVSSRGPHADQLVAVLSRPYFRIWAVSGCDLRYARLSGAHLEGANLSYANLQRADLSEANLMNCDARGANLDRATLNGTTTGGMEYDVATAWPSDVDPDDLGARRSEALNWS
jgi:uncharacterized protein YjbI with pentapeptide repeats